MRIETVFKEWQTRVFVLSAIRQYDEDWNFYHYIISLLIFIFQPFASMMRIETTFIRYACKKGRRPFSHSPVWWGLKHHLYAILTKIIAGFQPFASMMRIETRISLCSISSFWFLSAIRQYDEDWNHAIASHVVVFKFLSAIRQYDEDWNWTIVCHNNFWFSFSHSPVWWGLKLQLNRFELICFHLSAIRQYDEDWNIWFKNSCLALIILSAIRQYDEDWNYK